MRRDIVSIEIGCKSIRLEADGIQLQTKSGIVSIAWRDVKAAALAGRERREMPDPALIAEQIRQLQSRMESPGVPFDFMEMSKSLAPGASNRIEEIPSSAVIAEQLKRMKSAGFSYDWDGHVQMELSATHDPLWIVRRDAIFGVLIESSGPERDALLTGLRTGLGNRWLGENFNQEQLEMRFVRWGFKRTFRTVRNLVLLFGGVIFLVIVWTIVVYGLPVVTQELFTAFFTELFAGKWKVALIVAIVLAACVLLSLGVKRIINRSRYGRWWTGREKLR